MSGDLGALYAENGRWTLPDFADAVELDDEYTLAVAYRSDDTPEVWLVSTLSAHHHAERLGTEQRHDGCTCPAAHEKVGRLPREYRDRLGLIHRCGRPASHGGPCRAIVYRPGEACDHHRGMQPVPSPGGAP